MTSSEQGAWIMVAKAAPEGQADVFGAIAHPVRREILDELRTAPLTVKYLAGRFKAISRPAVSQHLAILLEAGLVSREQAGRENYYHLRAEGLHEVEAWLRHYERFWNRGLDNLGAYLERKADDDAP
jgi:DNA-binding transcriptional ArsR family regulator